MFGFQKHILRPRVTEIMRDIQAAQRIENITARTEKLLATKEEASNFFKRMSVSFRIGAVAAAAATVFAAGISIMLLPSGVPLLVGAISIYAGIRIFAGDLHDLDATSQGYSTVTDSIDTAVLTLFQTHPLEVSASKRFQKIRHDFNSTAPLQSGAAPAAIPSGTQLRVSPTPSRF